MKRTIWGMLVVMVLSAGMVTLASATEGSQIGFVDLSRVVVESSLGKKGSKVIEAVKVAKMKEVKKLKRAVEAAGAKVDRAKSQGMELSKLSKLIVQARQKGTALKRFIEDVNEDLASRNNTLNVTILGKANDAMLKIAKAKGLVVIYKNTDNLAYLDPAVDITNAVIKLVNKTK